MEKSNNELQPSSSIHIKLHESKQAWGVCVCKCVGGVI